MKYALPLILFALPANAQVVHLDSHGASATVIESNNNRTLILTCAHAFDDAAGRAKPITVKGQPGLTTAKLLALDLKRDIALLEAPPGRFPVIPVATLRDEPHGHGPYLSAGYDQAGPLGHYAATLDQVGPEWTYTREPPRHGRSGGALFHARERQLYGVVCGFADSQGRRRGYYASLTSIHAFLEDYRNGKNAVPRMPYAED